MKKIAIICARPTGERNPGMATVDLAAQSVAPTLSDGATVTLYVLGKPSSSPFPPGELPYEHVDIRDDPKGFLDSDAFIYWGDFLHARAYWEVDQLSWSKHPEKLREEISRYIFLADLPEPSLRKVVVFGSTIITNDASDFADQTYRANFERLFENAGGVFFRDALSAAKVSPLRGGEATLACDCALLLSNADLASISGYTQAKERRGVGVFFGRSPAKLQMMTVARLIARELREDCEWLPWFTSYGRARAMGRLLGYRIPPGQPSVGALLSALSGFRAIVTDTYHVCVNAWRLGIPAVCIGVGATVSAHSLSDKKKEILFEMYGARDYYLFAEQLKTRHLFASARRAAAALANEKLADGVQSAIASHADMARQRLTVAVRDVLGTGKQVPAVANWR